MICYMYPDRLLPVSPFTTVLRPPHLQMWFRAFGQQIRGKLREEDGSTKRIRVLLDSLDEATADVAALRYCTFR